MNVKPLIRNATVAGNSFRDDEGKEAYKALTKGDVLTLVLEPDNVHDLFAVKLLAGDIHIGYVPREMSAVLHATGVDESNIICAVSEVGAKGGVRFTIGILDGTEQ